MVDRGLLQRRLERLDQYLAILRRLQRYAYEEFAAEPERYGAERFLQLSIGVLDDLGSHLVADLALGPVRVTAGIPRLLLQGLLDAEQAECWTRMIGFRNVLVHQYLGTDRRLVYESLTEGLGDIEALQRVFVQLL